MTRPDQRHKFQLIRRWDFKLVQNTETEALMFHEYVALPHLTCRYPDGDTAVPEYGELALVFLGSHTIITEVPIGSFTYRIAYTTKR